MVKYTFTAAIGRDPGWLMKPSKHLAPWRRHEAAKRKFLILHMGRIVIEQRLESG